MEIFKIILVSILFSGFNSSPVTRDNPMENESTAENESTVENESTMENESTTEKQIRRRSTGDDGCRKMVSIICNEEKNDYPSTDRLQLFELCKKDGFDYYCR